MRINALLLALVCTPLVAQQSVSAVAFSESKQVIPAFSSSGAITLPAVQVHLDINYPRARRERGDLVVVYDPQNGCYFWRYRPLNSPSDAGSFLDVLESGAEAVYAAPDRLIDFYLPARLYVKEYPERAESLDAAERAAIEEIRLGLSDMETKSYHMDALAIPLVGISSEFACAPLRSDCHTEFNRIVSVSRETDHWRLVLRNRFDQEVILDSKFGIVSTRQLSQPPKQ